MTASDVRHDTDRRHPALVWTLVLLTVPAALAVVGFAYVQVLGTAACTDGSCGGLGPSQTVFGLILYGTPVVALAAVVVSFFTARRRWGIAVPVVAWIVIAAAVVTLLVTF